MNYEECNIPTCAIRALWPSSVPVESSGSNTNTNNPTAASTSAAPAGPAEARYEHALLPAEDHLIQRNKLATRDYVHHQVVWRATDDVDPASPEADALEAAGRGRATGNGAFVRSLKLGDMVTVWGRARFGGWQNDVKRVEIKVYWSID